MMKLVMCLYLPSHSIEDQEAERQHYLLQPFNDKCFVTMHGSLEPLALGLSDQVSYDI